MNFLIKKNRCTTGLLLIPPIVLKRTSFFFSLIWVYATSFSLGSNMTGGLTFKGKSSKGCNILFTSSMKRTFCDANKVRLRIIDRTIWRFEFGFSFWVLIRLITFLRGGGSSLKGKINNYELSTRGRRSPQ